MSCKNVDAFSDVKELLMRHYNEKYAENDYRKVKKITVKGMPTHRREAAVVWGGKGDALLEIGPGCGDVLLTLSEHYRQCVGLEFSPVRSRQLQNLFSGIEHVNIITGDFENMSLAEYPAESFDTVLMIAVLEHLVNPFETVKRIYGLLKPGGRLVIETPNMAKWTRRLKLLFGFFPSTGSLDEGFMSYDKKTPTTLHDEGHFHYFTYRSLRKLLLRFGFCKVEFHGYGANYLARLCPVLFSECFVVGIKAKEGSPCG